MSVSLKNSHTESTSVGDFVQAEIPQREFFSPVDAAQLVDGIFLPLHHIRSCADWGIGDFVTAKKAVDFSHAMGFHFLQVLPVTYSAAFHSPYSVASSKALDPEYANVEALLSDLEPFGITVPEAEDLIRAQTADIEALRRSDRIDHNKIKRLKLAVLRRIWEVFRKQTNAVPYREFLMFLSRNRDWLADHMLYLELKQEFLDRDPFIGWDWRTWDHFEPGLSGREPMALERARRRHGDNVLVAAFVQFVLDWQFRELVEYGRRNQVFLMVDMPFSPPDADIWINPALVGLKKENGYQRGETQGVPAKKENPVGQNWQFTAYDWSNPGTIDFFLDLFRISQERAVYVRIDHVLGIYRTYLFRQDVEEDRTLAKLGLYEPIQAIRERALRENTERAKDQAVQEIAELIAGKLADPAVGLPPDVIHDLFDETGRVRRGGNMIAIARKVLPQQYAEPLPADSLWQRWAQTEDLIFKNQPVWDYIRLSPNERAGDQGFLKQYLFPEDGTREPLPTDDLRPAYYRLAPAEKILSELLRLAQEHGTILILETLGTVPDEIENSTRYLGGYNYIPVIWGLDRHSRYHPTRFIRNAYATFGVADSESLLAAWQNLEPGRKRTLLQEFFPRTADHELVRHAESLTYEVHEKLLQMVYAPREIYPEIALEDIPLMAVIGLHDASGYPEEYRLNRPGESGQWSMRFPEEVAIEPLLTSAEGGVATERAMQVVKLIRSLQAARGRHSLPIDPDAVRLLRVRPDVRRMVMQIREIGENPSRAKPFYIDASVQGRPVKTEVVVTDAGGVETRFTMQPVRFRSGGVPGVTCWGAALQPHRVGNYTFRVEITRADGSIEASRIGYLFAVPEGADLNPLSPDYYLRDALSAILGPGMSAHS
jgi:4-alpha-glucanotransferase